MEVVEVLRFNALVGRALVRHTVRCTLPGKKMYHSAEALKSIIVSAARAVRMHGVVGAWRNARNSKHLRAGMWDGGVL